MDGTNDQSSPGVCPALFFDGVCANPEWREPDLGYNLVYISTVSCSASCVGSALIVLSFVLWKDIRTGLRKIVTFLAIADFFTASGYLLGNANYVHYRKDVMRDEVGACYLFDTVCQIQAFVTSWSSLSSFIWTAILAVYLYCVLVRGDPKSPNEYFVVYHVLSWASPLLVMLPLLCTGNLGYSPFAAAGWCFIATDYSGGWRSPDTSPVLQGKTVALILVGGKAVEICTYVLVVVLYSKIQWTIRKKTRPLISGVARKAENKLALIPILFILLRMWGTLQFFFSIIVYWSHLADTTGCISKALYYVYLVLTCAQAVGDGGQGWGNAIIYIFWTKTIRQRLILQPLQSCCLRIMDLMHVLSDMGAMSRHSVIQSVEVHTGSINTGSVNTSRHTSDLSNRVRGMEVSLTPSTDLIASATPTKSSSATTDRI